EAFMSVEETEFTFQLTMPTSGFAGMIVKPWEERDRSIFEILPEVQQKLAQVAGVRVMGITPPALPGGGDFPVEFVIASTADVKDIYAVAQQLEQVMLNSGKFAFQLLDTKIDQP